MSQFRYTPLSVSKIKLHAKTMAPATIAAIMCCPISTVELICRKHGIEMRAADYMVQVQEPKSRVERKQVGTQVELCIDRVSFTVIACEARRRGVPTRDLMVRLIEGIADDCLFNAILDA